MPSSHNSGSLSTANSNPPLSKARLVVIQQVYHQILNQQPKIVLEARYSKMLKSDEQSYGPRTITVGEEWMPLELGWLKDVEIRMLILTNEEGVFRERNPTALETAEGEKKILELSFTQLTINDGTASYATDLLVPPRESQALIPFRANRVRIRCRHGQARYTIVAVPA